MDVGTDVVRKEEDVEDREAQRQMIGCERVCHMKRPSSDLQVCSLGRSLRGPLTDSGPPLWTLVFSAWTESHPALGGL